MFISNRCFPNNLRMVHSCIKLNIKPSRLTAISSFLLPQCRTLMVSSKHMCYTHSLHEERKHVRWNLYMHLFKCFLYTVLQYCLMRSGYISLYLTVAFIEQINSSSCSQVTQSTLTLTLTLTRNPKPSSGWCS